MYRAGPWARPGIPAIGPPGRRQTMRETVEWAVGPPGRRLAAAGGQGSIEGAKKRQKTNMFWNVLSANLVFSDCFLDFLKPLVKKTSNHIGFCTFLQREP